MTIDIETAFRILSIIVYVLGVLFVLFVVVGLIKTARKMKAISQSIGRDEHEELLTESYRGEGE